MSKPIIRSTERVRDLGEVLTPQTFVREIIAQIPADYLDGRTLATVLEPSCGDGNFLVEILQLRIASLSMVDFEFKLLEQLSSLYGVDISPENILGSIGHKGARERLIETLHESATLKGFPLSQEGLLIAKWILEKNIQLADMLSGKYVKDKKSELQFISYTFDNKSKTVKASVFLNSEISTIAQDTRNQEQTLFSPTGKLLFEGTLSEFSAFCEMGVK